MDIPREAMIMLEVSFQKEVAREHVQGICKYFWCEIYRKKEVAGVIEQKIVLTLGQQKLKDSLVKYGLMAANYEEKDSVDVRLITMLAPLLTKLESKGTI